MAHWLQVATPILLFIIALEGVVLINAAREIDRSIEWSRQVACGDDKSDPCYVEIP